jgi:hypothetical protein
MSDELRPDAGWQSPHLQRLEARLAAAVPQSSAGEQRAILYAAAFAAGRSTAARRTRRWQGAAALLATAALAAWIPWPSLNLIPAGSSPRQEVANTRPTPRDVIFPAAETETAAGTEFAVEQRRAADSVPAELVFDAWQVARPASDALAAELAQFKSLEPDQQRMAVRSMGQMLDL